MSHPLDSCDTFHGLLSDSNSIVMAASSSSDVPMTESVPKTEAGMEEKLPVCMIVLGMAGSGKTTLVQVRF